MQVGDKLYYEDNGAEAIVTKVGIKYFEINKSKEKFHIFNLRTWDKAFRSIQLCSNRQKVLDDIEYRNLYNKLQMSFPSWNRLLYTLDQLRKANEILNP